MKTDQEHLEKAMLPLKAASAAKAKDQISKENLFLIAVAKEKIIQLVTTTENLSVIAASLENLLATKNLTKKSLTLMVNKDSLILTF